MLDYYAIGVATYPMTINEYYSMQEAQTSHKVHTDPGEEEEQQEKINIE